MLHLLIGLHRSLYPPLICKLAIYPSPKSGPILYNNRNYRTMSRFGRFPERNVLLDRRSTSAERAYLGACVVWVECIGNILGNFQIYHLQLCRATGYKAAVLSSHSYQGSQYHCCR